MEMFSGIWVGAASNNLLKHLGVGMRIQSGKTWFVLVMDMATVMK
jgi:hypothetical protein